MSVVSNKRSNMFMSTVPVLPGFGSLLASAKRNEGRKDKACKTPKKKKTRNNKLNRKPTGSSPRVEFCWVRLAKKGCQLVFYRLPVNLAEHLLVAPALQASHGPFGSFEWFADP